MSFTVAPSGGEARSATAVIAGQTFTVTQTPEPPSACTPTVEPRAQSIGAAGGTVTVNVTAGAACAWSASSEVSWIALSSSFTSAGNGKATFTVAPTSGPGRSATVMVADQPITITQSAAVVPCSFAISPESASIAALGGSGRITVTAGAGCAWTASSAVSWIDVTSGESGAGNGEVGFAVAPNLGGERSGTVTIADRTFTVTQAAVIPACSYRVQPLEQEVNRRDRVIKIDVETTSLCAWTAVSHVPWIHVASGDVGAGDGEVRLYVLANRGDKREGTATIAGQTVTVKQRANDDDDDGR
ncbi:MAG: BACON domain-containing protein [Vicinamibacterales bacterium]